MCDTEMNKFNCATQTIAPKKRKSYNNRKVRNRLLDISRSISNDSNVITVTNDEASKYLKEVRKYKLTHLYDFEVSKLTEKLITQLKLFVKRRTRPFGQLINGNDKIKCHKYNTRPRKVVFYGENYIVLNISKPTININSTIATNRDEKITNNLTSIDACSEITSQNSLEEKDTFSNSVSPNTVGRKRKAGRKTKNTLQKKYIIENKETFNVGKIVLSVNNKNLDIAQKFSGLSINDIQSNYTGVINAIHNPLGMLTNGQSYSESECNVPYTIEKRHTNGSFLESQGNSEQKTGEKNTTMDNNNMIMFNSNETRAQHVRINNNRKLTAETNLSVSYPPGKQNRQHFQENITGYTVKHGKSKSSNISLSWVNPLEYVREVDEDEYCANMELPDSFWNNYSLPPNWNSNDFIV